MVSHNNFLGNNNTNFCNPDFYSCLLETSSSIQGLKLLIIILRSFASVCLPFYSNHYHQFETLFPRPGNARPLVIVMAKAAVSATFFKHVASE